MNLFPKDYKPKRILGAFNYIKFRSEGNTAIDTDKNNNQAIFWKPYEELTIEQNLGNIRQYLYDMIRFLNIQGMTKNI